jgi:hypothetical protein
VVACSTDDTNDSATCTQDPNLAAVDPAPDCDPLQPAHCSLPWPSSRFLTADTSRKTGWRLDFGKTTLPANNKGVHAMHDAWSAMDGFGVGTPLVVLFPDVDASKLPTENDPGLSVEDNSPILLLRVGADGKGTRVPFFAEVDSSGFKADNTALFIRPLVILEEGTRYVVAIRDLVDKAGKRFEASEAFKALRQCRTSGSYLEPRQASFDEIFALIKAQGVALDDLQLAWDFTTASSQAMHGPLLHARDKAFEITGEKGPEMKIDKIEQYVAKDDGSGKPVNEHIALSIHGTFKVPSFVKEVDVAGEKGYLLNLGADGLPEQDGWTEPEFWARVPHSALAGKAQGIVQYGHGLLGKGSQVKGSHNSKIAAKHDLIFFACNWTGMAEPQEKAITQMIFNFSDFAIIPQHLHQGMVNSLMLGRAMRERFDEIKEIKDKGVVVDPKRFYYSGISQGGIYGATYMALSTDVTRGHLGVPGQNYSTLLQRSVDFLPFYAVLVATYPSPVDRAVLVGAGQILWDQVDSSSFYRHISLEPFAGTPKHDVLLASAQGDWQVALLTNEITVRSGLGVKLMKNYGKKVWGVQEQTWPYKGSALVNYAFGNPWPPPGTKPPHDNIGDPHGWPRKLDAHIEQMAHFFETGEIKDVCGGKPCLFAKP